LDDIEQSSCSSQCGLVFGLYNCLLKVERKNQVFWNYHLEQSFKFSTQYWWHADVFKCQLLKTGLFGIRACWR